MAEHVDEEQARNRVVLKYRWLREPLLHFLIAGGLMFAAYGWIHGGTGNGETGTRVVRITAEEVQWLTQTWGRTWQRQPSTEELKGLVASYLKESLLAREARELGLDENDTIVRRRLAQKMEFLLQDTARLAPPGEAELRRFYADNRARYETPLRISFEQLFYKTEGEARKGLDAVTAGRAGELGERTLLAPEYRLVDQPTVETLFGRRFAGEIFAIEPGRFQGPLASGYGYHLVRIVDRQPGELRPYEEVRARVRNDWNHQQQDKANQRYLASLLKKYVVVVDESVTAMVGPLTLVAQ